MVFRCFASSVGLRPRCWVSPGVVSKLGGFIRVKEKIIFLKLLFWVCLELEVVGNLNVKVANYLSESIKVSADAFIG